MQHRIAILVETSHASARETLRGVAAFVRDSAADWAIDHEPKRLESGPPEWFRRWRGDGVIARLHCRRTGEAVARTGLPAVDVLGVARHPQVPLVIWDDAAIGRLAAAHLLERGFRSFAFAGVCHTDWSEQRMRAYTAALAKAGHGCDAFEFDRHVRSATPPQAHARRLAAWLAARPTPLGVMAASDQYAGIVSAACREAGLVVPERVVIIGVDNDETFCDLATPSITSIAANHFGVGYEAARLLADRLAGRGRPHRGRRPAVTLPPLGIVLRRSTDCLAIDDAEVVAALRVIRSRAPDRLTIDAVAAEVGTSRSTLVRRFRALVGHGVHDEIMQVRVREAQRLLAESDLTILAIARQCGFEYQEHLGRVFRQRLGISPARYRRTARRPRPETGMIPAS